MSRPRWFLVLSSSLIGLVTASSATLGVVPAEPSAHAAYGQEFEQDGERLGTSAIGRNAYSFVVTDIDGETIGEEEVRDTPYTLVFAGTPCRFSERTVARLVEALEEHESMRAIVVVFQPERGQQAAPNLRVAARTFAQQHVAGKQASERVQVGVSDERIRIDYGSLVFDRPNMPLNEVPALFTVDEGGVIRGALIGDATRQQISEAMAAALEDEDDDE